MLPQNRTHRYGNEDPFKAAERDAQVEADKARSEDDGSTVTEPENDDA